MKLILRKLHSYMVVVSMGFFFFLLWPPLYYASLNPKRYGLMIKLRHIWAFCSSFFVGIVYQFEFEEPINWNRTYIICPNHTSNLDTSMVCMLLKNRDFCFMGKAELMDSLITGIYFRTIDIPVNRDSKMSAFRAFKAAEEKLEKGIHMIMFPEGGIADDYPPELQDFKSGPFRLAIQQGIPIIPVTSINTWDVFWDTGFKYGSRPGVCKIFVHKPIETIHLSIEDTDGLRDHVKEVISQKFKLV
jgi:1-acyl-sn-glycerol-3-phosphate acyltransferase